MLSFRTPWLLGLAFAVAVGTTAAPAWADSNQPAPVTKQTASPGQAADEKPAAASVPAGPGVNKPPRGPGGRDIPPMVPMDGPMRIEFQSFVEMRVTTNERGEHEAGDAAPNLRVKLQLKGERLKAISRVGDLVITEMVDDTGRVLAKPSDVPPAFQVMRTPNTFPKGVLYSTGFLLRMGDVGITAREANKVAKLSGWLDVLYADDTVDILIDHIHDYIDSNKLIEHPRLAEYGVKLRIISPGKEAPANKGEGKVIGLLFEEGRDKFRQVQIFDDWMRPSHPRTRELMTADGEPYTYVELTFGFVTPDSQMLLTIFPNPEWERIPFSFEDLPLP